jgi:Ca-activated chloride channel family protein
MNFLAASRLWLFVLVALLLGAYLWRQRHRQQYAVRFTNLALLDTVAPKRPGWRRHVSAAAFLVALSSLLVGFARPTRVERVPVEQNTIVMAIDVSGSMAATDVEPSRIEAARTAASQFVELLPKKFELGLVVFNQTATAVVPPTNDHASVTAAIATLRPNGGTAIGEAIYTALNSLASMPQAANSTAPSARVVLMSDGSTNAGRPNDQAAAAAAAAHVPVTTIAYGTDTGQITVGNRTIDVPADKDALQRIADETGGKFFQASSASQLRDVYNTIRSAVSFRNVHQEITMWFMGLGLVALAAAAGASIAWSPLLP